MLHTQFTPAMIFADLTHYPAPPSNAGTDFSSSSADECLSAVLSSPSISPFDELSPYPAPPSTASTDVSSCSASKSFAVMQPTNALAVTIPPRDVALFDLSRFSAAPSSDGSEASFSSFSTTSPAMALYSPHPMPPSSSGCLYEAAMSQAIAPQSTFPAQFNYRAAYPGMLPVNHEAPQPHMIASQAQAFFNPAPMAPQQKLQAACVPSSSFDFSIPLQSNIIDIHTHVESSPLPAPPLAPTSSFLSSFMPAPFANQIPGPEFITNFHRHSAPGPLGMFPYPAALTNNMPQLSRSKDVPEPTQDGLNLYDATGIRDSGLLFASNGRILLACSFCKLRKLRCNGGAPGCSQCAKRGLCCSYPTTIRRRGKAKRKASGDLQSQDGDADEDEDEREGSAGPEDETSPSSVPSSSYQADENSRSASEEPDLERSRKRKGTSFGSESLLAPAFKKRSQSCHGTAA
ncbi:hypothetical protein CF327_g3934 [Tilletia walkeri]|nr:hypothetical protein CF327_g3934 [Tilletia walkeri]